MQESEEEIGWDRGAMRLSRQLYGLAIQTMFDATCRFDIRLSNETLAVSV